MIITIEGGDGCGKATQSKLLVEKLCGTLFSFPTYSSLTGKLILSHLKKEWAARMPVSVEGHEAEPLIDAMVFQSLQTVNRLELLPEIEAAHNRGPVIVDRYWQSAVVYGTLDGLDPAWLRLVQERPMPPADVNILIDAPVELSFQRRPERRDRYETNRAFLEKVRVEYLRLWGVDDLEWANRYGATSQMLAKPARPDWWVVDGRRTIEEVQQTIMQLLMVERLVAP